MNHDQQAKRLREIDDLLLRYEGWEYVRVSYAQLRALRDAIAAPVPPAAVAAVPDDVVRDSARYRWLRRKVCVIGRPELSYEQSVFDFVNLPRPDYSGDCLAQASTALDFAIDAAMLAAAQAQEGKP